jgi:hypothetical protein
MKLYYCKVAHPAVTHRGFSIIDALKKVGGLEIHAKDDGAVALVELDGQEDELYMSSHPSVDDAMFQARMDFGIEPHEWARSA